MKALSASSIAGFTELQPAATMAMMLETAWTH
jgi:hypothetical protein